MIFLGPNEHLLFTKGISGKLEDGKIVIISGTDLIKTNYDTSHDSLKQLEENYKIKLIGKFDSIKEERFELDTYSFYALHDGQIFDSFQVINRMESKFNQISNYYREHIFGEESVAWQILAECPIGLAYGGLAEDFFISHEVFTSMLGRYRNAGMREELKHKLIYYFDVEAIINDLLNNIVSISEKFVIVQRELNKWLCAVSTGSSPWWSKALVDVNKGEELAHGGWTTRKLQSMYMDNIIGLRATLDIFTKLIFELGSFPQNFSKPVKLAGNNKHFTNLDQTEMFRNPNLGYEYTLFAKIAEYEELSILRNELVHRCYLASLPKLYFGKDDSNTEKHNIFYAICFIWDIQPNGKPYRWVNRHRFYGNQLAVDEYLVGWILKVYTDIENTLDYILNHLS